MEHVKCIIIGSGPAGYTAAIYASRANLNPVEYCGLQPGGQLTQTTEVENFPGYPQGVDGNQMMMDLREQAERFGTDIRDGSISRVDFSQRPYKLWAEDGTAPQEPQPSIWDLTTSASTTVRAFLPAPPATDSSTARRPLPLSAAATPPAKTPSTWRDWPRRCTSLSASPSCVPQR